MAIITPQTDLVLLQCPLEPDQQNQLTFSSATAQYNYFNSLQKIPVDDFTYQRKDGTIRFPAHIDDVRTYNYCMYRNDAYSNKWFYAFITNMEYANDGVTMITISTDVWQTWQFDLTFKRSFVEREHTNNDAVGANTLDEGLPIGEPIMNDAIDYIVASNNNESQRFVAQVTELPEKMEEKLERDYSTYVSRIYNGIPQGCYFCVFRQVGYLQKFIRWYDKNSKKDAVVSLFIIPYISSAEAGSNIAWITQSDISGIDYIEYGLFKASYNPYSIGVQNTGYSATLDGYTPKNQKLYCYPYSYLYVSNNAGSDVIYHYEDWSNPASVTFSIKGNIGQGCSIQAIPSGYKRLTGNSSYGAYAISCAKLPMISWTSDYYLNWQAQNGVNNVINASIGFTHAASNMAGGIVDIATGSGSGRGVTQTISGLADMVGEVNHAIHENYIADLVPNQAQGNTNCAELTYSMQKCGFTFRKMSCRREYAEMIDNYFSMFGYKTNKLKLPNITGRTTWNFVKTRNCNVIGNIPQDDIEEIKDIFNTGITLWHNPATFLDYSQNNTIV